MPKVVVFYDTNKVMFLYADFEYTDTAERQDVRTEEDGVLRRCGGYDSVDRCGRSEKEKRICGMSYLVWCSWFLLSLEQRCLR